MSEVYRATSQLCTNLRSRSKSVWSIVIGIHAMMHTNTCFGVYQPLFTCRMHVRQQTYQHRIFHFYFFLFMFRVQKKLVCIPPEKIKINLPEESEEVVPKISEGPDGTGACPNNTCSNAAVVTSSESAVPGASSNSNTCTPVNQCASNSTCSSTDHQVHGHVHGNGTECSVRDSSSQDLSAIAGDARTGDSTLAHGADMQSSPSKESAVPEKKTAFDICDEISSSIGKIHLATAEVT
jgi:hypothetical protein